MRYQKFIIVILLCVLFTSCKDQSPENQTPENIVNQKQVKSDLSAQEPETNKDVIKSKNTTNTNDNDNNDNDNNDDDINDNESMNTKLQNKPKNEDKPQTRKVIYEPTFDPVDPKIKPTKEKLKELSTKYDLHMGDEHKYKNEEIEIVDVTDLWDTLNLILYSTDSGLKLRYWLYYGGQILRIGNDLYFAEVRDNTFYYCQDLNPLLGSITGFAIERYIVNDNRIRHTIWNEFLDDDDCSNLLEIIKKDGEIAVCIAVPRLDDSGKLIKIENVKVGHVIVKDDGSVFVKKDSDGSEVFVGTDAKGHIKVFSE